MVYLRGHGLTRFAQYASPAAPAAQGGPQEDDSFSSFTPVKLQVAQELEACSAGWLIMGHGGACCGLHCGIAGITLSQCIFLSYMPLIMADLMGIRYRFAPDTVVPQKMCFLRNKCKVMKQHS